MNVTVVTQPKIGCDELENAIQTLWQLQTPPAEKSFGSNCRRSPVKTASMQNQVRGGKDRALHADSFVVPLRLLVPDLRDATETGAESASHRGFQ